MGLREDYDYCENIIKTNSKSFYKAFSALPQDKRCAVYAIYAFCRVADDSIDLDKSPAELKELLENLQSFALKHQVDTPIFRALKDSFEKYELYTEPFFYMVKGQEADTDFKCFSTLDELKQYCFLVAGTVGLMILPVLATKNHVVLKNAALKLGEAMQITNILRDIGEDLDNGRIYIPIEYFSKHNYSLEQLKNREICAEFISLWEDLATVAEANYAQFTESLSLFDEDSRAAVQNAARYYRAILDAVRENKYNCMTERCYVKKL